MKVEDLRRLFASGKAPDDLGTVEPEVKRTLAVDHGSFEEDRAVGVLAHRRDDGVIIIDDVMMTDPSEFDLKKARVDMTYWFKEIFSKRFPGHISVLLTHVHKKDVFEEFTRGYDTEKAFRLRRDVGIEHARIPRIDAGEIYRDGAELSRGRWPYKIATEVSVGEARGESISESVEKVLRELTDAAEERVGAVMAALGEIAMRPGLKLSKFAGTSRALFSALVLEPVGHETQWAIASQGVSVLKERTYNARAPPGQAEVLAGLFRSPC